MRKLLQQSIFAVMAIWALSMIQSQMAPTPTSTTLAMSAEWPVR